jgi:hypothetical protein
VEISADGGTDGGWDRANADPTNVLRDQDRFNSLTDQERCAIYRNVIQAIRSSAEAAVVFRFVMSGAAVGLNATNGDSVAGFYASGLTLATDQITLLASSS